MSEADASAQFWDDWNAHARQPSMLTDVSLDQRREILRWLRGLDLRDARILEVGCGTGWLCESLAAFGHVTGTDLSQKCLEEAARLLPQAEFVAGDFMELTFAPESYDVVVSLEVLAHVPDQRAFVEKIAGLLKPGGRLMLATQNKPMLQRWAVVAPQAPGQVRQWRDQAEIRALLEPHFAVEEMYTVTPIAHRLPLRLLTAKRVRALIPGLTRWEEKRGWGWTIMVLARKRAKA